MTRPYAIALLLFGMSVSIGALAHQRFHGYRLSLKHKMKNALARSKFVSHWLIVFVPVLIAGTVLLWAADYIPLG